MHAGRREQRGVWGVVDSLETTRNYVRPLPPPAETENGQPRGAEELTRSLPPSGLLPESLVVSDGWRGYNRVDWEGEFGCAAPQRVNHRAGEIVNEGGFATNQIDNLWSNISGADVAHRQPKNLIPPGLSSRCAIVAVFR